MSYDLPLDAGDCFEPGCSLDAVTTRPAAMKWLLESGVLTPADDVVEWVCSIHIDRKVN